MEKLRWPGRTERVDCIGKPLLKESEFEVFQNPGATRHRLYVMMQSRMPPPLLSLTIPSSEDIWATKAPEPWAPGEETAGTTDAARAPRPLCRLQATRFPSSQKTSPGEEYHLCLLWKSEGPEPPAHASASRAEFCQTLALMEGHLEEETWLPDAATQPTLSRTYKTCLWVVLDPGSP